MDKHKIVVVSINQIQISFIRYIFTKHINEDHTNDEWHYYNQLGV